jgi:hypothetical protein
VKTEQKAWTNGASGEGKRSSEEKMNTDMSIIRLLGVAQLVVFVASMVSERLLASMVGSCPIASILVNVSKNLTRMRISNLVALLNSLAIVVLAVMFYAVFYKQYRIIALVALVCFVAEAITLAVSKIGTYGLIPLSQEFVEAGAPEPSYLQTLGDFLYYGLDRLGYDIHIAYPRLKVWVVLRPHRRETGDASRNLLISSLALALPGQRRGSGVAWSFRPSGSCLQYVVLLLGRNPVVLSAL